MGKLQRTSMIVFAAAAILGVGMLAVAWFAWPPLLPFVRWLADMAWFPAVELALLGITAAGLAAVLIRALSAPSKKSQLVLKHENGSIAFTQNAIQSAVKHVIETHRGLTVDSVRAEIKGGRNPHLSVRAKIDPGRNAELGSLGAQLQAEVAAALSAFTGYPVESVCITFAGNADVVTPAFTQHAVSSPHDAHRAENERAKPVPSASTAPAAASAPAALAAFDASATPTASVAR